jgi:hypothetical protein
MGANFLWPRTPDPMRRMGVGILFGMGGTFFQSMTEWVFHQTPIFFTFNILLGVLASLIYLRKLEKKRNRMANYEVHIEEAEVVDEPAPEPDPDDPFVVRRPSFC